MRFAYQGREYVGPSLGEGWQQGFTIGELRWAKKALKLASTDDLETAEGYVLWAILSIRRADHTVLPIDRFNDLSMREFTALPHPLILDRTGSGCLDCGGPAESPLHEDQGQAPDPTETEAPTLTP